MTDEIKPALSPEEWTHETYTPIVDADTAIHVGFALTLIADQWWPQRERLLPATIAMLNNGLPDDSPYKITRADVSNAESAASTLEHEYGVSDEDALAMARLAAKLAALLPPE